MKKWPLTVLDIGAHKGETIDFFLKNFNLNKIYSFEPNNELFLYLKKKFSSSEKIKLFNLGLGDQQERRSLNVSSESSSSTLNIIDKNTNYYKKKEKIILFFSKNKNYFKSKQEIEIEKLSNIILSEKIEKIDILKIDVEGYEFEVLKGLTSVDFRKINYVYFEHHYDLMLKKNYKFADINYFLKKNNFELIFKLKMNFRKSFEYIYKN